MSERHFDKLTRAIADNLDRRGVVRGLFGTFFGAIWAAFGRSNAEAKKCGGNKKKCKGKCCKKQEKCCNGQCCRSDQLCVNGQCGYLS